MADTAEPKNQRILIVEDDPDNAEIYSAMLEVEGYEVVAVDCGEDALDAIKEKEPDLILLDVNLPDINGIDVLKTLRANSIAPTIVYSGYGKGKQSVTALNAGADDYLTKPFSREELTARIYALLRRVGWAPKQATKLQVNDLELDMPRRQVTISGENLHLTPIEYGILSTLMRNVGKVISHEELIESVWGSNYREDYSVLRVNISRLRQKVESDPRRPKYIQTVPGKGYQMPQIKPPPKPVATSMP